MTPIPDHPLDPEDPVLNPGWHLLQFLLSLGADEFTLTFLHVGDESAPECDQLIAQLAPFSLGQLTRECVVTYTNQSNPRPTETWRFNHDSLIVLRQLLPDGILTPAGSKSAWTENLCIFRQAALLFGTVTHETYAFLRLPPAEWQEWQNQSSSRY
jgi:hypothetical protein